MSAEFKEGYQNYAKTFKCINYEKLGNCWYKERCFCWHHESERNKKPINEYCRKYYTKSECDSKNPYFCVYDHYPEENINKKSYHVQSNYLNIKFRTEKGKKFKLNKNQYKVKLDRYIMPKVLRNFLEDVDYLDARILAKNIRNHYYTYSIISSNPTHERATQASPELREHYHNLLYLEELQCLIDIRQYDKVTNLFPCNDPNKKLSSCKIVHLAHLAEKRPSVMLGDEIIATLTEIKSSLDQTKLIGYVWQVNLDNILVNFGNALVDPAVEYNLIFSMNRTQFKLKHRSIDMAYKFYSKLTESKYDNPITYSLTHTGQKHKDYVFKQQDDVYKLTVNTIHQLMNLQIEDYNIVLFMADYILNEKYNSVVNYSYVHPDFSTLILDQNFIELEVIQDLLQNDYVFHLYFDKSGFYYFIQYNRLTRHLDVYKPSSSSTNISFINKLYEDSFKDQNINDEIQYSVYIFNSPNDPYGICSSLYHLERALQEQYVKSLDHNTFCTPIDEYAEYIRECVMKSCDHLLLHTYVIEQTDSNANNNGNHNLNIINNSTSNTNMMSNTYNELNIMLNDQQQQFLDLNVRTKDKRVKILFGPPGTGKTQTLIELVRNIYFSNPEAKILLCASSNTAADLLCQRLTKFVNELDLKLLRLNAVFRNVNEFPRDIEQFCIKSGGQFAIPPLERLKDYHIIASTCVSAGYIYSLGYSELKDVAFDYIMIDEAGECNFIEAFIPLQVASQDTKLVFSGDWKQLGPIVRSKIALQCGFDESVIEKCIKHYSGMCHQHMLIKSYRAHRSIMALYNSLFYDNNLIAMRDPEEADTLYQNRRDLFPGMSPVQFIHIEGQEERLPDSPSWYNDEEIAVVIDLIKDLVYNEKYSIQPEDIGVIAPYRKQVVKIIEELRKINLNKVSTGTVEFFQGQERRIIIISTVRSRQDSHLQSDAKFRIGFVSNFKRMNVAISRAMDGLFIVGNAKLLGKYDTHWNKLIYMLSTQDEYQDCISGVLYDDIEPYVGVNIHMPNQHTEEVNHDVEFETDKY